MRPLISLLILPLLLAGCEDAVGVGSTCSRQMRDVRQAEGQPDKFDRREHAGSYTEVWRYERDRSPVIYVFRWGAAYDSCEVEGPVRLNEAL
jgi:hypothetical protein